MDDKPFQRLSTANHDVFMLYDYTHFDHSINVDVLVGSYRHITLIGWSMGVWVAQELFSTNKKIFDRTIAINGTLCPVSDTFGIPEKLFDGTISGFGEAGLLKFYRRMCKNKTNLKRFLQNRPERTLENQLNELIALRKNTNCVSSEDSIFDEIIIADNDFIVPSENQHRFWQDHLVKSIKGHHFLFNLWDSWDQLLMTIATSDEQV